MQWNGKFIIEMWYDEKWIVELNDVLVYMRNYVCYGWTYLWCE